MSSYSTITKRVLINGVLTDPTSIVFSDSGATYGVKRTDTNAVVVAAGTSLTKQSTGVYSYTFLDPASALTYAYVVKIVYGGMTIYDPGTKIGGVTASALSTTSLYNLLPRISPYLNGCPDPVVKQFIRVAAYDFCSDTEIWAEDLAAFHTVADQEAYILTHGYDAHILRVTGLTVDDTYWGMSGLSTDGVTISLDPIPNTSDLDVVVSVVFVPDETCTAIPTHILQRFGGGIVNRTLALLKSMVGPKNAPLPWSDPQGAQLYENLYQGAVFKAKREMLTGRGPANMTMPLREFV